MGRSGVSIEIFHHARTILGCGIAILLGMSVTPCNEALGNRSWLKNPMSTGPIRGTSMNLGPELRN